MLGHRQKDSVVDMNKDRESIIDWIESADSAGRVSFTAPAWWIDSSAASLQAKAKVALKSAVYSLGLWKMLAFSTKASEKSIALSAVLLEDGNIELGFNLAQGFGLPMVDPSAELAEIKAFFVAMKPVYERTNAEGGPVQGVVCFMDGSIAVDTANGAPGEFAESNHALTQNLRQMVSGSSALQVFLAGVTAHLKKVGPYSWFHLRESEVYGRDNGPYEVAMLAAAMTRAQERER